MTNRFKVSVQSICGTIISSNKYEQHVSLSLCVCFQRRKEKKWLDHYVEVATLFYESVFEYCFGQPYVVSLLDLSAKCWLQVLW